MAILIVVDRFLKDFFLVKSQEEIFIFGDLLKLKLAYNTGLAFSLPVNRYLVVTVSIVILFFMIWFLVKEIKSKNYWRQFFWLLAIGGAVSNFYDRLVLGKVIDYLSVKYYSVLNLADVMICLGVIGLIVVKWKQESVGIDKK